MPDRPHHTEKFKRCVEKVKAEGHEESSAYAICTTSFQKAGNEIFEAATHNVHLRGALGKARMEKWDGRDHLVVPIVALMEGVIHAVNADDPEYVSLPVLQAARDSWNGRPIMLGHPSRNGKPVSANEPDVKDQHSFGIVRNSEIKGNKLGMEALIDVAKLEAMDAALLESLRGGQHVEVSVGAFVRTAKKDGVHGKKKYKAEWLEISGDHVAMLPGGIGACSGEMGCGANRTCHLVTAEGFEVTNGNQPRSLADASIVVFTALEGESFEERMQAVSVAVRERWPPRTSSEPNAVPYYGAYPQQVYDDHVIVRDDDGELYWCDYAVGSDGKVSLGATKRVKQVYVAAIGARNSKQDSERIQGVHDHACALGARCDPENCVKEMQAFERIRYEGGKWALYSSDGLRRLGIHDSKTEATDHEAAIEAAKRRRNLEVAGVR